MSNVTALVENIANGADQSSLRAIQDHLIKLQHSLETPFDTIMRIYDLDFQHAAVRIGADLKVFISLSQKSPQTTAALAAIVGGDIQLIGRILRYLASVNMIDEVAKDNFAANTVTRRLAEPDSEGGIRLSFDVQRPTNSALPDFLIQRGYKNIVSATDTAFNKGWKTDLPCFSYLRAQPKLFGYLHHALQIQYREHWLSKFPLDKYLEDYKACEHPDKVLFVDVGGSHGIQCAMLKQKYPHLQGRVILQDLQETIASAKPLSGVEMMAQDYLEAQKVQGAKLYYYRNIFHDNPDERCRIILQCLAPAMGQGSILLIDDKVLPAQGLHRHVTMLDLAMMAQVGSLERTFEEWEKLLSGEGFAIIDVVGYSDEHDSVLVVQKI